MLHHAEIFLGASFVFKSFLHKELRLEINMHIYAYYARLCMANGDLLSGNWSAAKLTFSKKFGPPNGCSVWRKLLCGKAEVG